MTTPTATTALLSRPETIEQLRLVLEINSTDPGVGVATVRPAPGWEHAGVRRSATPAERASRKRRRAIAEASRRRNRGR